MLRQRLCLVTVLLAGTVGLVRPAAAQLMSNASLTGAYYVRYLGANINPNNPFDTALSFSGTFTFDGKGAFTVTGQGVDAATSDHSLKILNSGIYTVLPGGNYEMTNPFDSTNSTTIYGGVGSTGVVTGSSTDTNFADLFVAFPVSTSANTPILNGKYFLASLEFQNGDFQLSRDTFFSATANNGSFGNVTINGTALNLKSAPQSQTSNGVTYTVAANGSGTINFPAPAGLAAASQLLAGNKVLYVSQDGSFFVAGGATAFDMILGVRAPSGNASTLLTGLYFTSFLENYANGGNADGLYGVQGTANEILSIGTEIAHQRTNWEFFGSYDFTTAGTFTINADGTAPSPGFANYVVGVGGNIVIGSGDGTNYQLTMYSKAPSLSGPGTFLNPQGVVNAANNVPFTAQVAPGEVVSLYGTGMSPVTATAAALPFASTLGGVGVDVSWVDFTSKKTLTSAAPVYYVSPTLISVVVPYDIPTDGTLLNFVVNNNGIASNPAREYSGATSPGIFTVPSGGLGNGAILHTDFSLVSLASPAKVGETVQIFLTGMGAVTPPVAAGSAAPTNPLSTAVVPDVFIDGVAAKVVFSGLAPTLGGLYQLNVTIPPGVTAGTAVSIEILTDDADNFQAMIPISK